MYGNTPEAAVSHEVLSSDWYVDGSRSRSGNGTSWQSAFRTVTEGIKSAKPGNTIHIAPWHYYESFYVYQESVTLTGQGGKPAIASNLYTDSNQTSERETGIHVVADNVSLRNLEIVGFDYGIFVDRSVNATIHDVVFDSHDLFGVWADEASKCEISGSEFRHGGAGIFITSASNAMHIINNIFHESSGSSIYVKNGNGVWIVGNTIEESAVNGIYLKEAMNTNIEDNAIHNSDGSAIHIEGTSENANIIRNIITYSGKHAILNRGQGQSLILNNLILGHRHLGYPAIHLSGPDTHVINNTIIDSLVAIEVRLFNPTIANNLIAASTGDTGIHVGNGLTPVIHHNNISPAVEFPYGGAIDYTGQDGNTSKTPILSSDFRLLKTSFCCIDTGSNRDVPVEILTDFEGNARALDGDGDGISVADQGADEYLPVRSAPDENAYALQVGNKWSYRGVFEDFDYAVERRVSDLDLVTFSPMPTVRIEEDLDGQLLQTYWYSDSSNLMGWWGFQDAETATMVRFKDGLSAMWYPLVAGQHRFSETQATIADIYAEEASLSVHVVDKELISLAFGQIEAFKLRYRLRFWDDSGDFSSVWYHWVSPHMGIVKYENDDVVEELVGFLLDDGRITQLSDSDGDGLGDYQERYLTNTDWLRVDTDMDGCSDLLEVSSNRQPHEYDPQGDLNADCDIDLKDVIIALKTTSGVTGSFAESEVDIGKADVNGDMRIGLEEGLYVMGKLPDGNPSPMIDPDADGVTLYQGDCDIYDPFAYPGAVEHCGDGIDQDCDSADPVCMPELQYASESFNQSTTDFLVPDGFSIANGKYFSIGQGLEEIVYDIWNGGQNPSGNPHPQTGDSNYFSDFDAAVTTYWMNGDPDAYYGLIVCMHKNSEAEDSYLSLQISKNGIYLIGQQIGNNFQLMQFGPTYLLNLNGSQNRLGIEKKDSRLRFYINGTVIAVLEAEPGLGGGIGLVAENSLKVAFDDFSVSDPYRGELVALSPGYIYQQKRRVLDIMSSVYLWRDQVPSVDLSNYSSPEALLYGLTYDTLDKWSYIVAANEFDAFLEEGKYIGIGLGIDYDSALDVRVTYVYSESPADRAGIERGDKIIEIGGQSVSDIGAEELWGAILSSPQIGEPIRLKTMTSEGAASEIHLTTEWVSVEPILHSSVINEGGKRIGYLVYQEFIDISTQEIDDVFAGFKSEAIDALILDLRYNPGGLLGTAKYLAELIGGNRIAGSTFAKLRHNAAYSVWNAEMAFDLNANAVDLDAFTVITTESTCSASEMLINGLKPYMSVSLVGTKTCGKPVGMYAFDIMDKYLCPVANHATNANNEGAYYEGILPTCNADDDLTKPLGDTQETMLHDAIYLITSGSCTPSPRDKPKPSGKKIEFEGFRRNIDAL